MAGVSQIMRMHARSFCSSSNSSLVSGRVCARAREAPRPELVVLVHGELGVRHGNEEGLRHPARELVLHLLPAPPQHHRGDAVGELLEIPVTDRSALGVQLVVLPVEAEQRTEQLGIQKLDDGVDLVDAILQRGAGEDECIATAQPLDRVRGLGLPVLDALRLVQDDDVRLQEIEDLVAVGQNLLVVAEREEGSTSVCCAPREEIAEYHARGQLGETGDLLFPLRLQRHGRHHEHALDAAQLAQQGAGGDRLHGLAEAHVVGEQRALPKRQVQHAVDLIRQQRPA